VWKYIRVQACVEAHVADVWKYIRVQACVEAHVAEQLRFRACMHASLLTHVAV
jgi:hypothetical protein